LNITDECVTRFTELKLSHTYRYVIFRVNESLTDVVVDTTGDHSSSFSEFVSALPSSDCRYAVFDFEYDVEGSTRSKIVFVLWSPDSSRIKAKMLYTTTKDALKKKLVGIGVDIQATDLSEIDVSTVLEKVKSLGIH